MINQDIDHLTEPGPDYHAENYIDDLDGWQEAILEDDIKPDYHQDWSGSALNFDENDFEQHGNDQHIYPVYPHERQTNNHIDSKSELKQQDPLRAGRSYSQHDTPSRPPDLRQSSELLERGGARPDEGYQYSRHDQHEVPEIHGKYHIRDQGDQWERYTPDRPDLDIRGQHLRDMPQGRERDNHRDYEDSDRKREGRRFEDGRLRAPGAESIDQGRTRWRDLDDRFDRPRVRVRRQDPQASRRQFQNVRSEANRG